MAKPIKLSMARETVKHRLAEAAPMRISSLLSQYAILLLTSIGFGWSDEASAQSFPTNPIRIVVPTGPGSPPDVIGRVIAAELSESEGWRAAVDNRPGALQTIAMTDVLRQPADGHSILVISDPIAVAPALMSNLGIRPSSDFMPIVKISTSYTVLVVTPSLPVKSVSDLVALLKKEPDRFNFSGAFGTPAHLLGELFKLQAGVRATFVPYQQGLQRISDLLNGTTHFAFNNTFEVVDLINTGKLRALALTGPKRIAALDVPTVVEQGFPDLAVENWVGFAVRSGTRSEIVNRLNETVNKALKKPQVREAFAAVGAEPVGGAATEFDQFFKSQLTLWGKVVKESGIKLP
jgi:tripartite-type tricarboxylate transporter receptor subunit TctC